MRFFNKQKKGGWFALSAADRGSCVAQISGVKDGKPVVAVCELRQESLHNDLQVKSLVETFGLKQRRCTLLLETTEYQMFQVETPSVPEDEIKQAVRWKLKDMIDYAVEQATVDVLDIPGDPNNAARTRYVYAVAARNELITTHMTRLMDQGAGLQAIGIHEMAQRNIASYFEVAGHGLAMLSFSNAGGLLTFSAGGELYYARQFETSLAQLQEEDEERQSRAFDRVALELQRSFDGFDRQFPYIGIDRLLLAPFPARQAFREFLSSYLNLQIETFQLSDVFDLEKIGGLDDLNLQAQLFGVLGAALREVTA